MISTNPILLEKNCFTMGTLNSKVYSILLIVRVVDSHNF